MNKLVASIALGVAAIVSVPALAADPVSFDYPVYKDYVPPYIPPVDVGLKGSFYLRGSLGGNLGWAHRVNHPGQNPSVFDIDRMGVGYSAGIGAGFETGDGLRFDVTLDHLHNDGMSTVITGAGPVALGRHDLHLRSTIALANVYYDFGLGDIGLSAAGGAFGYVGAGAGLAFNRMGNVEPGATAATNWGSNTSFAAAGMVGVGYDFGALVADLGYRGLYINRIENSTAPSPYHIDHALIHELRASLRYRFN
ncbi:outer membrane protein [Pelagibacterium sediminicola]|uniref:outer membrane protein n=1 Tax=Pelagibacterium sediminicola TaxID=2248761 RepID=UPI000E31B911|nr:hypothetical protein [Pelagibacterium sediminicola]